MMDVTLVGATQRDLPRLLEWMRELRRVDPMETEQLVPLAIARSAMERLIADPSVGQAWLIQADARAIGYVVLVFSFSIEFGGRTAFIDELFIEEAFRGKGIGRRTIEIVEESARRMEIRNLLLEVSASNPATRLYSAAGFVERKYRLMSKWIGEPLA
jgi:diamine N-acetyltransferase